MDISVIVICPDDALSSIERCDTELCTVLGTLGMDTEVIYVVSGSSEETLYELRTRFGQGAIKRRVVVLRRYTGIGAAFAAGVQHSSGHFILTIDPELTVDPIEIPRLVDEIAQGYDVVLGWRQRQHLPLMVQWRSRLVNSITSAITGVWLHDYGTPLRIFRREIVQYIPVQGNLSSYAPVFAYLVGGKIREIQVIYRPNYYIRPEYTAGGYLSSALDVMSVWFLSRYAHHPLSLFGRIGLFLMGLAVLLIGLDRRNSTVLAGIAFGTGLNAFLLGLDAEMIQNHYTNPTQPVLEVLELS